jgi:hypothetical protein
MSVAVGPVRDEYNYEHFRRRHLAEEVWGFLVGRGVRPGDPAPEFELPAVGGGVVRLADLRDRPTLLHFGSYT